MDRSQISQKRNTEGLFILNCLRVYEWRGLTKKKRFVEILGYIFSSLGVCRATPEESWEIDKLELRRIVEQAVEDIEMLNVSEADDN